MNAFFPRSFLKDRPVVDSADGVFIRDKAGKQYLDGSSGAIVSNLGHGLNEINRAIKEQLDKVAFAHTSQFWSQPALDLAEKLIDMAPASFRPSGRVYLTSGGSESIETALKMARSYFVETGERNRHICISRNESYHGSTLGALSATGHPLRRKPYLPTLKAQTQIGSCYRYRCPCGFGPGPCPNRQCDLDAANQLEKAIHDYGKENIMCFLAEPIVGAALGAATPGPDYWKRISEICTRYGVLLIVDEVMVGLGRTGTNFAIDHWSVDPDIIVLGKGLAAGYQPLGAVLASSRIVEAIQSGSGAFEHGFTYSGHPVAAAAGLAAITYLNENRLVQNVARREKEFFQAFEPLADFDCVGDIRGRGFFMGVEFVKNKASKEPLPKSMQFSRRLCAAAEQAGLLIYPGSGFIDGELGDHVLIAPPFVISSEEIQELVTRFVLALEQVADKAANPG